MTREDKIERTAEKYAEGSPNAILIYRAFKDGVRYADRHPAKKQSIWNNVNETPSENSEIVVIDTKKEWYNISYSFDEYDDTFGKGWESCVRTYDIDKWAYLNDLINL